MPALHSATPLLLDASCVISLYASSQMEPILGAYPAQIGVVDVVRTGEMLDVWDGPDENVRRHKSTVNLLPFITAGVLVEVPSETIDMKMVVNLAAALVPLNVQTRVREQFFWTSRLERVMLLLSSTYLSPGGDHDLNPHTMPLL